MYLELLRGPVAHLHVRPPGEEINQHYQPAEKIQFSQDSSLAYIRRFTGNQDVRIILSDHPDLVLHPNYSQVSDKKWFYPDQAQNTINDISLSLNQRVKAIKSSPEDNHVLTGVEADILSADGLLSVRDQTLSRLDVVIASLHYWEFAAYSQLQKQGIKLQLEHVLKAYENTVQNTRVDVLGHPTLYIQPRNRNLKYIEDWNDLLEIMQKRKVAYEINLGHKNTDLRQDQCLFERDLIQRAAAKGVLFLISLDLHNLASFGSSVSADLPITMANLTSVFEKNRGNSNLSFLLFLERNLKLLSDLGVIQENIVNSTDQQFDNWLVSRNS